VEDQDSGLVFLIFIKRVLFIECWEKNGEKCLFMPQWCVFSSLLFLQAFPQWCVLLCLFISTQWPSCRVILQAYWFYGFSFCTLFISIIPFLCHFVNFSNHSPTDREGRNCSPLSKYVPTLHQSSHDRMDALVSSILSSKFISQTKMLYTSTKFMYSNTLYILVVCTNHKDICIMIILYVHNCIMINSIGFTNSLLPTIVIVEAESSTFSRRLSEV